MSSKMLQFVATKKPCQKSGTLTTVWLISLKFTMILTPSRPKRKPHAVLNAVCPSVSKLPFA